MLTLGFLSFTVCHHCLAFHWVSFNENLTARLGIFRFEEDTVLLPTLPPRVAMVPLLHLLGSSLRAALRACLPAHLCTARTLHSKH